MENTILPLELFDHLTKFVGIRALKSLKRSCTLLNMLITERKIRKKAVEVIEKFYLRSRTKVKKINLYVHEFGSPLELFGGIGCLNNLGYDMIRIKAICVTDLNTLIISINCNNKHKTLYYHNEHFRKNEFTGKWHPIIGMPTIPVCLLPSNVYININIVDRDSYVELEGWNINNKYNREDFRFIEHGFLREMKRR